MVAPTNRDLVRPRPASWWLQRGVYVRFMLREWTCVFVAAYAYFLLELIAAAKDPAGFDAFCGKLASPGWVALHLVILAAVCFHAGTWFIAAGKILVVRRGENRVPPALIVGGHYAAWLATSAIIAGLVLWMVGG